MIESMPIKIRKRWYRRRKELMTSMIITKRSIETMFVRNDIATNFKSHS